MSTSAPSNSIRQALNHVLGSVSAVRLLRILSSSEAPLSVTWLAQASGLTPQGTRLALDVLVASGVVRLFGAGRSRLFVFNFDHPFAQALQHLFVQEQARSDRLTQSLKTLLGKDKAIQAAWQHAGEGADVRASRDCLALEIVLESGSVDPVLMRLRQPIAAIEATLGIHCQVRGHVLGDLLKLAADPTWWSALTHEAVVLKGPAPASLLLRAPPPVQGGLFAPVP